MRRLATLATLTLILGSAQAQEGNGYGDAYVSHTPAIIGDSLTIEYGSPGLAHGAGLLSFATGYGPTFLPGVPYPLWIDLSDPNRFTIPIQLDANGHGTLTFSGIPNDVSLANAIPFYMYCVLLDTSLPAPSLSLSISKTVRLSFENADSYQPTAPLAEARFFHTGTETGANGRDNETSVLVAGGASGTLLAPISRATTEIYRPLLRGFEAGPTMITARAAHQAVRLANGHVLIIGGLDASNNATTDCEIFDPATDTLLAAASMNYPRAGHSATVLNDGRVLVVGGLQTYANAGPQLVQVLATAQTTAEIFDPATGVWTETTSHLAAQRMGHAATLLPDGRVLISGGVLGGAPVPPISTFASADARPVMTAGCEIFNPATGYFSITSPMVHARAFHTATHIPGTGVLVTGGCQGNSVDGGTYALNTCELRAATTWAITASLPSPAAFHRAILRPEGDVLIVGGLTDNILLGTAVSSTGIHDGVTYVARAPLNLNPARPTAPPSFVGAHSLTPLYDGTYLVVGGGGSAPFLSAQVSTSAWVYIDN